ncbi:hypothetical protein [Shewanella sp.]|uniref:hypothetical protein n=1 Tax=Shewanella sp. TaxID=50422 RepID=UPI0040549447
MKYTSVSAMAIQGANNKLANASAFIVSVAIADLFLTVFILSSYVVILVLLAFAALAGLNATQVKQ